MSNSQEPRPLGVLLSGLWDENPTLVTNLGLCPTLAVTNSVANGLTMGIATLFVLVCSSLLVSSVRRHVPNQVRIATFVLIIATFVTIADMVLEALVPTIHRALGAFIALIVVNCIILGRQEAFAAKNTVGLSILDALGAGTGFTLTLLAMSIPRELLGSGSILGVNVMGPHFEPWVIMVLPPGGFLMIALLLMFKNWQSLRAAEPAAARTAAIEAARAAAAGRVPQGVATRDGALA